MTTSRRSGAGAYVHQPEGGITWQALILMITLALEGAMLVLLYATYSETMAMMSGVYLSELPGVGWLFGVIDEEMTVSHLLAFLLAVFSIGVPMVIWQVVLSQRIYEDWQGWISKPANRVLAGIALGLYGLVFALETVNLYTLIAQSSAGGPFRTTQTNVLMSFLAANQGLGVFVAALVAIVNAALAFACVWAAHLIHNRLKG